MSATLTPAAGKRSMIPWIFVGAMGLVVAVNATMVTLALRDFSGVIIDHPYEAGLEYNRAIAAEKRQEALGWSLGLQFERGATPLTGRLVLTARDAGARPLAVDIQARLVRPIDRLPDVPAVFRPDGAGRYVADVAVPRPGQWELRAVNRVGGARYDLIQRVFVP
jgi:nitrogen fixation protein FixH